MRKIQYLNLIEQLILNIISLFECNRLIGNLENHSKIQITTIKANILRIRLKKGIKKYSIQSFEKYKLSYLNPINNLSLNFYHQDFAKIQSYSDNLQLLSVQKELFPYQSKYVLTKLKVKILIEGSLIFKIIQVLFFNNQLAYIKAKPEEKQNLKLIGSSFLTICLESIRIWANWIPVTQNGNESVFKKAYENLLERKVTFCFQNQYYKKPDEQKFNKTYKIQFFDSSDIIDQQSQFAQNSLLISQINKLQEYKHELSRILEEPKLNSQELDRIKVKIWKFHIFTEQVQKNIQNNSENEYQQKRNLELLYREQVWSQNFLSNYNLLVTKKINYQDFIRQYQNPKQSNPIRLQNIAKLNSDNKQSKNIKLNIEQFNINENMKKKVVTGANEKQNANFKKSGQKNINLNIPNVVSNSITQSIPNKEKQLDILLKQQKSQYLNKINQLEIELKNKNELLQVIKTENQIKQQKIKKQYEDRIKSIKQKSIQIKKNDNLAYQIKQLNDKIVQLETQISQLQLQNQKNIREKQTKVNEVKRLDSQINIMQNDFKLQLENKNIRIQRLQSEIDKQKEMILNYKNQIENQKSMIQKLQSQANNSMNRMRPLKQNEERLIKENQKLKNQIEKHQKDKINIKEELTLYKQQLNQIRNKHHYIRDKQIQNHEQSHRRLRLQLEDIKKKNLQILKLNDAKDIEIIRLNEINQNNQRRIKELQLKKERFLSPERKNSETQIKTLNNFYNKNINNEKSPAHHVEFTKSPFKATNQKTFPVQNIAGMKQYSDFFLKMTKQLYLRFCKACLKAKELLYKENQFQLGLITQKISSNKIKFVLHFTNNSEFALKNFKIKIYSPKTIKTTITNQCVTTIESLQQQKQEIFNEVLSYPIKKINLEIQYEKNYKKQSIYLLLPATIIKFCDFYRPTTYREKLIQSREFKYSSRIIQNGKSLMSYIKEIRQVSPNIVYDVQVNHRHTQLVFFLKMIINNNLLILEAHGGDISNYQKEIINQFINVMQFIFIK